MKDTISRKNTIERIIKICFLTISLLLIFNPQLLAQSTIQTPANDFIAMLIKNGLTKFVFTVVFGFFTGLSTVCIITYLFFNRNKIILWYIFISLSLSTVYLVGLVPYYFHSPLSTFLFFSVNNVVHMAVIFCGYKIIQDITGYHHPPNLRKVIIFIIVVLVGSTIGFLSENNSYIFLFQVLFLIACFLLMRECYLLLKRAVKEKELESSFVKTIIILSLLSYVKAFPLIREYGLLIFNLRLLVDMTLPFGIAAFLALVFAKNMKIFYQKQNEIESLTLEKQTILKSQNETLATQVAEQTFELNALNSTKDRLFSIIGHDLRSPIASLKGVLLLLDNQQLSREEFDELLQHLQKNVDNVHGMLENLLQWSMSQMKGMKPNLKTFEINDVIEQTIELFKDAAKQKNIELKTNISENLMVFADENHVRAVIRNLLNNALKFTPKDGNVSVSGKFKNNFVELQIINSGMGISTDELQNIFSNPKLKQGTAGEKGTGLGLILCRDLIKQNSGEISVKSDFMKSTTFEILIPKKAELSQIQPN